MRPAWREALRAILVSALLFGPSPAAADEALRDAALELVNAARRGHDLPPLAADAALTAAAQAHAADMLRRDYHAHTSPEGGTMWDRFRAAGGDGQRMLAENIARILGDVPPPGPELVARLHRQWMSSRGHRENILHPDVSRFGFGVAAAADRLYAVQTFAGPGGGGE